jgi:hypothetical protein
MKEKNIIIIIYLYILSHVGHESYRNENFTIEGTDVVLT